MNNNRQAFIEALADNEDDETTRLIYADWLEEHGEYAEAQRQRQWTAAKARLVEFVATYQAVIYELSGQYMEEEGQTAIPFDYEEDLRIKIKDYKDVVAVVLNEGYCSNNERLCDLLRNHAEEILASVSVISGQDLSYDGHYTFSCGC